MGDGCPAGRGQRGGVRAPPAPPWGMSTMRRFATGLLIVLSALSLFAASLSLWTRHNVINTGVFVSNVESIADLPKVEARVNEQVTATVMKNPQVQGVIDSALAALPPRLQQFRPTVEN